MSHYDAVLKRPTDDPELAQAAREASLEELQWAHDHLAPSQVSLAMLPGRVTDLVLGTRLANRELKDRPAAEWREEVEKLRDPLVQHAVACVVYWDYISQHKRIDDWWSEKVLQRREDVPNSAVYAGLREVGFTAYNAHKRLRFEDHESTIHRSAS